MYNELHRLAFSPKKATRIKEIPHEKEDLDELGSRNPFVRDKDRILYSKPFRRLAYKTQVYVTSNMNDDFDEHCRTRLSHTLEVANIAKRISLRLKLNSDLAESIALGHDVGHTPFGHAGEKLLNEFLEAKIPYPDEALRRACITNSSQFIVLTPQENFTHSYQSVRLLTAYNDYSMHDAGLGLRLTFQTLAGILKHTNKYKEDFSYPAVYKFNGKTITFRKLATPASYMSIEANIVAISDEIAQVVHDIADAIKMLLIGYNLIRDGQCAGVIERALDYHRKKTKSTTTLASLDSLDSDVLSNQLTTCLIEYFSGSTIDHISKALEEENSIVKAMERIGTNPHPNEDFVQLNSFKDTIILNSPGVVVMDTKGKAILQGILDSYIVEPRQLPDSILKVLSEALLLSHNRIYKETLSKITAISGSRTIKPSDVITKAAKLHDPTNNNIRLLSIKDYKAIYPILISSIAFRRVLVDYISQMTDNFAEDEFRRLRV